jgi:hypothetical protein
MAMKKICGYLDVDVAAHLGVSVQTLDGIAARYGWREPDVVGGQKVYDAYDIDGHSDAVERGRLYGLLGASGEPVFDDTHDGVCPACGALAVFWQPDVEKFVKDMDAVWACASGHSEGVLPGDGYRLPD